MFEGWVHLTVGAGWGEFPLPHGQEGSDGARCGSCGFLTFDKVENAEKAIGALNDTKVEGVELQVSYSRRQPKVEPINDASTSSAWSTIGEARRTGRLGSSSACCSYSREFSNL